MSHCRFFHLKVAKLETQVEGEEVPGMFIMVNLVLGSRTTNP
jgi:hypothetical protein